MVHAVLQRDPKWRGASLAQVEKQVAKLEIGLPSVNSVSSHLQL